MRIGRADVLSLAEARERAKRPTVADFLLGHDPKSTGGGMTLGAALDGYLAARKTLRPKTVADYRGVVVKYLAPWLNVRLKDISADMVEKRHRSLHAEVAARGRHAGNAIANGAIRTFGTLFSFAAEREVLPLKPRDAAQAAMVSGRAANPDRSRRRDARLLSGGHGFVKSVQRDYLLTLLSLA